MTRVKDAVLCPICGAETEGTVSNRYYCTNDECDLIYFVRGRFGEKRVYRSVRWNV